jgi:hypothetical protein
MGLGKEILTKVPQTGVDPLLVNTIQRKTQQSDRSKKNVPQR